VCKAYVIWFAASSIEGDIDPYIIPVHVQMSAHWAFGHLIVAPPSYIDLGFFLLLVFKTQAESHHSWERVCARDIWVTQGFSHRREEHFRGDRTSGMESKNQIGGKVCCFGGKARGEFPSEARLLRAGFSLLVVSTDVLLWVRSDKRITIATALPNPISIWVMDLDRTRISKTFSTGMPWASQDSMAGYELNMTKPFQRFKKQIGDRVVSYNPNI